jgi:GNAT superfamily N-acetyltransferase
VVDDPAADYRGIPVKDGRRRVEEARWSVRTYEPARHEAHVHALWLKTFGGKWAIDRRHLSVVFPADAPCFVALERGRLVGFVGTVPALGSVAAIVVDSAHQRRGVGRSLFEAALDALRRAGCTRAVVGGLSLLWKGVPTEFSAALQFFLDRGATPSTRTIDQFRRLSDYEYPPGLDLELARRGVRAAAAHARDAERILLFERTHFPHWAGFFSEELQQGRFANVLYLESRAEIVGTALIHFPGSLFPGAQWSYLAADGIGGGATLGIAPAHRGKGLGYALSAFVTQRVKQANARICFLNQSDAVPLYRKLGFHEWAEYQAYELAL